MTDQQKATIFTKHVQYYRYYVLTNEQLQQAQIYAR